MGDILPEFTDPLVQPDRQNQLDSFWNSDSGIIAAYTRPLLYESGRLVVFCDSPAWATQVRHQTPSLVRQLAEHSFTVSELVVKIIPESVPTIDKKQSYSNDVKLSGKNAQSMESLSQKLSHKGLRHSLKNLAKKGKGEYSQM